MAGSNLSDEELQQAAAEAGISPHELRMALAERQGSGLPARPDGATALVAPSPRGISTTHVEGRIGMPPRDALATVRRSIERQTGKRGHHQGDGEVDLVDAEGGLTYHMQSTDDGGGGALVRIDIDTTQGKGAQTLATTGVVGLSLTLLALGWLFGATTLALGGLGMGALGGLLVARSMVKLRQAAASAQAIASHALMEAEDRAEPGQLPPAR